MRWIAALALLGAVALAPAVAGSNPTDRPDIECEQGTAQAPLAPLGAEGSSLYNVSNITSSAIGEPSAQPDVAIVDLVLYVDSAMLLLPNGMIVRVVTADYVASNVDFSLEGLQDIQQNIWEIVAGNLIGTLICCILSGIAVALEKQFQCIGGKQMHDMLEQQQQLHEDLMHATEFLDQVQNDPQSLSGKGRALSRSWRGR